MCGMNCVPKKMLLRISTLDVPTASPSWMLVRLIAALIARYAPAATAARNEESKQSLNQSQDGGSLSAVSPHSST